MAGYIKPDIQYVSLNLSEDIAGLSDWLNGEGKMYQGAGILTYDACSV